jgi:hypothetical protein
LFIQALSRLQQAHIEEIKALIPEPKTPGDKRKDTNQYVRLRLTEISNLAIGNLALIEGHQLSLRELRQRLKQQRFSLPELLSLAEMLIQQTFYRRAAHRLSCEVQTQLIELFGSISPRETLHFLRLYQNSTLQRDWEIVRLILSARSDATELRRVLELETEQR